MPTVSPNALDLRALPSSLLLSSARLEDALLLAKKLLADTGKVDTGNHPDLHVYQPEGKTLLHPMANIQRLIKEMALPPFESKCKVFIITEADRMLPTSSNALLKTLEEPAADTYFLLLSDNPDRLLPTIMSRLYPLAYEVKDIPTFDLSPYFELAKQGNWDMLLDTLSSLEEEDPEMLLNACLDWASNQHDPALFYRMMQLVEKGRVAIQHNVRLIPTILDILLAMYAFN